VDNGFVALGHVGGSPRLDLRMGAAGDLMIADSCTPGQGGSYPRFLPPPGASHQQPHQPRGSGPGPAPRIIVDRNPRNPGGKLSTILAAAGQDASAVTAAPWSGPRWLGGSSGVAVP